MRNLTISVLIFAASLYYTDLDSESLIASALAPLVAFISLVAVAVCAVILMHRAGINQHIDPGGGGFGGDGGC